jgi:hypothetical protein
LRDEGSPKRNHQDTKDTKAAAATPLPRAGRYAARAAEATDQEQGTTFDAPSQEAGYRCRRATTRHASLLRYSR